jgi:predicted nuclease of predicted toxin-antitoxin system
MRFKLDENLPLGLAADLNATGHDAATCRDEGIGGTGDPVILAHATAESRVLITCDLDFSDVRRYPPGSHAGIMVLRLVAQDLNTTRAVLSRALAQVTETDVLGNLVIVEENRLRIRRAGSVP